MSLDRIRGCLLGGALGDAVGGRYEGSAAVGEVVFECGPISDDTQLTLATCEAIVAAQGAVKPALIADRFVALPKEAAALDAHAEIVRIGDALGRVLNR